jgi:ABC-type glycerol-3-phosphate transport system permease component
MATTDTPIAEDRSALKDRQRSLPLAPQHLPTFSLWTALIYATLIIGGILFVAPFVWMVSGSLQNIGDIFRWPPQWIPRNPTLDNYARFFETQRIGRFFFNSAYVAVAVTVMQLLLASLAAYAFAKRQFPGRDALFLLTLGTMMIPGQVNRSKYTCVVIVYLYCVILKKILKLLVN